MRNRLKALGAQKRSSTREAANPVGFQYLMYEALQEAGKAREAGEVPIGALVAGPSHEIIARAHNQCISLNDPTAHAEILAIRQASKVVGNYRLNQTTILVTIEPCPMCIGAILNARIETLVFGAFDSKFGASGLIGDLAGDKKIHHKLEVIPGVLEAECRQIMQQFFRERR
ncbi:MAG: tRNA adenosine(34) deaminase TadA [Thermodesulfobacteriota bacterium]